MNVFVDVVLTSYRIEQGGDGLDASDVSNDVAAAGALVKHVERLRGQWSNVLQDTVYNRYCAHLTVSFSFFVDGLWLCGRLASHLVETVIRGAMKPVLEVNYKSPTIS